MDEKDLRLSKILPANLKNDDRISINGIFSLIVVNFIQQNVTKFHYSNLFQTLPIFKEGDTFQKYYKVSNTYFFFKILIKLCLFYVI